MSREIGYNIEAVPKAYIKVAKEDDTDENNDIDKEAGMDESKAAEEAIQCYEFEEPRCFNGEAPVSHEQE